MRYVALVRGINVRGKKLAMADLRAMLGDLGHEDVATYVQSGNAVFSSEREDPAELAAEIEEGIAAKLGLDVRVMVRTAPEIAAVIAGNPFPDADANPRRVHVVFLEREPDPERLAQIDPCQYEPDEFRIGDRTVYLRFPDGYHTAKLTNDFWERRLGMAGTARNWNTVMKINQMLAP
ncbi:MAG TPA: DUF1697 domain-containing protein [Chloroflexota bacterium]|nr:DUF1697 domain-containing protein [Chloroflexota bacterium]